MSQRIAQLAVACALVWGAAAWADPVPMTRAQIVDNAKSVVGFSYWWGGGAWLPGSPNKGKCTPNGANGCPDCSHSGSYGADCSGFVGKAWQIDKPTPLEKNYHPYSTWHFDTYTTWWTKPAKGEAKQADAFNYNSNGAGHVFMFDKGDPWGSAWAWECKGCVYGCVYNLRSVSSYYGLIRRKLITEPQVCKPHCEGSVVVDADCGKGDCGAYAATCVDDDLGVRCVSVFCPAKGKTSTCLPDPKNGKIATCTNGALSDPANCGQYGAICSTAVGAAKCVSAFCASSPTAKPVAGDFCYENKRYTCSASGDLKESPCPAGQPCQTLAGKTGPGSATCGPKPCGNCDDGNPCTDDSCADGACVHAANSAACNDGDPCSDADKCDDAQCHGTPKACDDGVACTADACSGGTCSHKSDNGLCDDGNPCTGDTCAAGGCVHANQPGPCDDGDGCTVGGGCKDGVCQPGVAKQCDDENMCTADSCKEGTCLHLPLEGLCDDGEGCTHGDYCAQGQCLAGVSLDCDDGLACTADSCKAGKCLHVGPGPQEPNSCSGSDVWIPPPCPGLNGRLEKCPVGAPCVAGQCTGPDGGAQASVGDGRSLSALGDSAGGTAGYAQSKGASSGCASGPAGTTPLGWALLALVSMGLLRLRRRSDLNHHG